MSWSIGGKGQAKKLREVLLEQFARSPCPEPEESIRQLAGKQIDIALGAMPPNMFVQVSAYGSQSALTYEGGQWKGPFSNSLSINISPMEAMAMNDPAPAEKESGGEPIPVGDPVQEEVPPIREPDEPTGDTPAGEAPADAASS